jgi:hypothetical protein
MQDRGRRDEQIGLRKSMTYGFALLHEATPDDKHILVDVAKPIRKPWS